MSLILKKGVFDIFVADMLMYAMIKLLKNFTKKEWLLMFTCFILIFVQVWLDLKMPDYMSEITVLVQTEGSKMKDILTNGAYMLLCAFGSLVSAIFTG